MRDINNFGFRRLSAHNVVKIYPGVFIHAVEGDFATTHNKRIDLRAAIVGRHQYLVAWPEAPNLAQLPYRHTTQKGGQDVAAAPLRPFRKAPPRRAQNAEKMAATHHKIEGQINSGASERV